MIVPREARPEDRGFIVSTWVRSFAEYAPWTSRARTLREHWNVADRLLDAPTSRVVVLCSVAIERTLHAWACADGTTLHYVYVPPELRGHGLARRVITAALDAYPETIAVTHPWPARKGAIDGAHPPSTSRFRWDPYPLFAALGGGEAFRDAA